MVWFGDHGSCCTVVFVNESEKEFARLRQSLDEALPRIVDGLVARGASLVLLFGSEARGERRPLADLDLIAVVETDEPFIKRLARFYRELQAMVAMDLLVYTPAEFEVMKTRPFLRHVLREAKVLYAA